MGRTLVGSLFAFTLAAGCGEVCNHRPSTDAAVVVVPPQDGGMDSGHWCFDVCRHSFGDFPLQVTCEITGLSDGGSLVACNAGGFSCP